MLVWLSDIVLLSVVAVCIVHGCEIQFRVTSSQIGRSCDHGMLMLIVAHNYHCGRHLQEWHHLLEIELQFSGFFNGDDVSYVFSDIRLKFCCFAKLI